MKTHSRIILLLFSVLLFSSQSNAIELIRDNKSDYSIIISAEASYWDSVASIELQKYLEMISGTRIVINNDSSPFKSAEIVIGKNKRSEDIDLSGIRYDGFIIKTSGEKLFLTGVNGKGSLNAVYTFLEKFLSCRMYSAEVKIIPEQKTIYLPEINIAENPVFTYRDINYYDAEKDDYCRWHKLVDSQDKKMWGMFVHTFHTLMPPEKYFDEHPEYFSLRGSLRVPDEPCLSHPEVYKIILEELRKRITANPEAKIWSVSQNDNFSCCQCPECALTDSLEESPAGSVIRFVNKIASEFPDKIISTLAYQYSRKAPKLVEPAKNVNIMLCTIECYRTHPIESDSANGFVRDLREWSKLTNNIFLWDYVVQFANLISPFPNFQVLQPNIKLFSRYGVKMMFQQGAGNINGTEFKELRTYLISKLLWNPDADFDSLMDDFLTGYYGKAGMHLKEYIKFMQDELFKSRANLWIYSNPVEQMKDFLNPSLMDKYNSFFDEAENSVRSEPAYLERVKNARLPLMYAMLEQAKIPVANKNGIVIKNSAGKFQINPAVTALLDSFFIRTKKISDVFINESALTPDKYYELYKSVIAKTKYNPLAMDKPVKFVTMPNWKYPANGEESLTDGYRGDNNHFSNWVGFEGNDMEIVLDLQKNILVKKVSMDFLQNVFSWIFLPEKIAVYFSEDGNNFSRAHTVNNTDPINRQEVTSSKYAFIKNFSVNPGSIQARFIKVKAENIDICPRWHPGYPYKAWIFTDEIVVE